VITVLSGISLDIYLLEKSFILSGTRPLPVFERVKKDRLFFFTLNNE
jgi:hypothetical protein